MGEIIGNSDSCNWQASVGWALAAHAFHATLRQPETRQAALVLLYSAFKSRCGMATRDLCEQINSGKISRSQFSPEQLKAIQGGKSKIPEYTWHHHQDRGRMQLVNEKIHSDTGHIGGDAMHKGK